MGHSASPTGGGRPGVPCGELGVGGGESRGPGKRGGGEMGLRGEERKMLGHGNKKFLEETTYRVTQNYAATYSQNVRNFCIDL